MNQAEKGAGDEYADGPVYVLGTGLSHNGSAVLLRDGRVCVGIEKERLTRSKHDGGNDSDAIRYCLDAEGITLQDVALVVQTANFDIPARHHFEGPRLFGDPVNPPLAFISHHLAHAWSAAGTTPFDDCAIMVIDGCGSPYWQCTDRGEAALVAPADRDEGSFTGWCEKDSLYHWDGHRLTPLLKDFSPLDTTGTLPTTVHSIGGFYAAVSRYVFGDMRDVGKLMGLAPYGKAGAISAPGLSHRDGRTIVEEDWKATLDRPSKGYEHFRANFQYYADVARWAQGEVESAIGALFRDRLEQHPADRVSYAGGVALNAVANARLIEEGVVGDLYIEPAAGDNGIALGCAYYGWIELLGQTKVPHDGNTCFGRSYTSDEIRAALASAGSEWTITEFENGALYEAVADLLAEGQTIGWFQGGCEFGPRALGRRSILANPGIDGMRDHINANIKFREDFRPFAPAILPEHAAEFFEAGRSSPYMILVDRTKPEWREKLESVTHVNGTARVQTVERDWNAPFANLLEAFRARTGLPVLLNTSFNRRGMPIVETPAEACTMLAETALDAIALEGFLVRKHHQA